MDKETNDEFETGRPTPDAPHARLRRPIALAIVHHANQYMLTDGYDNRPGIHAVVGSREQGHGLACILDLHRAYRVVASLHLSGTLLECLAWYEPRLLVTLRQMYRDGLLELVGSAYGQNVMRFFSYQYNVRQLNESLRLYRLHLGVDPQDVKSFWPPERVWDTESMAAVLRDPALRNGGYESVLVDDRLLLPTFGPESPRLAYDRGRNWDPQLFHSYRIARGQGLVAVPIAANLRRCVPPRDGDQLRSVRAQLRWLSSLEPAAHPGDLLAVYADDMEKPAGVGWDPRGPSQFEDFLRWVSDTDWVRPVKVSEWTRAARVAGPRALEVGTYQELAHHFDAGETYDNWYFDPRWAPYREHFSWSEQRVRHLGSLGADSALMALAEKHLLASSWETAWHTTADGAHGIDGADGGPSSWARAVASHSRHAAVIAEAAFWQRHKDEESHAYLLDIDNDGEQELILKNDRLFAVISPRRGGRLVALFAVDDAQGTMVIGNPTDDWHFKEELNDYMDVPANHPGGLADVGFEHDDYVAEILVADGLAVSACLRNVQAGSPAFGLEKTIYLSSYTDAALRVEYDVPEALSEIEIEFALSPDYLQLLRCGSSILTPFERGASRGCMTYTTSVWVRPEGCSSARWAAPYRAQVGHGRTYRLALGESRFGISIGVDRLPLLREHGARVLRLPQPKPRPALIAIPASAQEVSG
jgi:hypothetical protein